MTPLGLTRSKGHVPLQHDLLGHGDCVIQRSRKRERWNESVVADDLEVERPSGSRSSGDGVRSGIPFQSVGKGSVTSHVMCPSPRTFRKLFGVMSNCSEYATPTVAVLAAGSVSVKRMQSWQRVGSSKDLHRCRTMRGILE